MRNCPNCDEPLRNEKLCLNCGYKLNANDFSSREKKTEIGKVATVRQEVIKKDSKSMNQKNTTTKSVKKCPECKTTMGMQSKVCLECGFRFDSIETKTSEPKKVSNKQSNLSSTHTTKTRNKTISSTASKDAEIPTYHYFLLPVSIFLGFTWIIPLIGVIASFIAYADLEEKQKQGLNINNHIEWTVVAGVVHGVYVVVTLVMA